MSPYLSTCCYFGLDWGSAPFGPVLHAPAPARVFFASTPSGQTGGQWPMVGRRELKEEQDEKEEEEEEDGKWERKSSQGRRRRRRKRSGQAEKNATDDMGPRGKELLAVVEFGSRPQGRLLIPHRQFINNTLVRVCIGMRSFPFTLILNSPPPLSLSLHPDDERCHPGPIHPSIHPSPSRDHSWRDSWIEQGHFFFYVRPSY